jgi:WD40 repeat protein
MARLWETGTGAAVRDFEPGTQIGSVAVSPDGTRIALGLNNGQVQLWDTASGALLRTLDVHSRYVGYVAFSPDSGTLVASANGPGPYSLPLWDVEAGVHVRDFLGPREPQSGIFSPDGRYVIARGRSTDARAILWDAETGAEIRTFTDFPPGPDGYKVVQAFAFSPDGRYVLIGSANRTAHIFEVETGTEVRSFNDNPGYVLTVAFSPDGKWILIASADTTVRLWPANYHDMIAFACEHLGRDFTDLERTEYSISANSPTCPQFGGEGRYMLPEGMTPIPTQPIPVWTPIATPTPEP